MIHWSIGKRRIDWISDTEKIKISIIRMAKVRRDRRLDILKAFKLLETMRRESGKDIEMESIYVKDVGFVRGKDRYMEYLENEV